MKPTYRPTPRRKELETEIQAAICDYLALRKHFFWRSNNIPVFANGQYRSMPKYSMKGTPDIILIQRGQFVGLEVKRRGNKQSPEQKVFETASTKAGARYYVVYSIEDVKAAGL